MTQVDLIRELLESVSEERRIIASGTEELLQCAQRLLDIGKAHREVAARSLALIKQITETLNEEGKK